MAVKITKKNIVGVSITSGRGIEVAVIDNETKQIIAYTSKPFEFDSRRPDSFDPDVFKDLLSESLNELQVPVGTGIVLNIPTMIFSVKDLPAALDTVGIQASIIDDLSELPNFQNDSDEPTYSFCKLPNSTIQFHKVVCSAFSKTKLIEVAMQIKELKYKLLAIDTSVNSFLNALIYSAKIDITPGFTWALLLVEDNVCRIILMDGVNYVDYYEEKITIGSVLGEEENLDIVYQAIAPTLGNITANLLYVVSKTDLISARVLAKKITHKAQIVHLDVNMYAQEPLVEAIPEIEPEVAKTISSDVIGISVKKYVEKTATAKLNLFNELLGDIYLSQTPISYKGYELSVENMLKIGIPIALVFILIYIVWGAILGNNLKIKQDELQKVNREIAEIQKFLDENKEVSAAKFSESDEIKEGITHNKEIYSYYTIVGTEIPQKVWLTALNFENGVSIEGKSDNLESVYSFYRNIKDYNDKSGIKLQRLGLAEDSPLSPISENGEFDTESILTSLNADYYEFKISNINEEVKNKSSDESEKSDQSNKSDKSDNSKKAAKLPKLEPIDK